MYGSEIQEEEMLTQILSDNDDTIIIPDDMYVATSAFKWHGSEIRCFAHTLQLAVSDAVKMSGSNTMAHIEICRTVAKQLRLLSIRAELAESDININKIRRECLTRWSSLYFMVS